MKLEFDVNPIGKPRMTQRDRWLKLNHWDPNRRMRPAVKRYFDFRDSLKKSLIGEEFQMPESGYHLKFYIPMPDSWSKKKKALMNGEPHKSKPDKDNLEKAFLDSLCEDDSYIWDGRVSKFWSYEGKIVLEWKDG